MAAIFFNSEVIDNKKLNDKFHLIQLKLKGDKKAFIFQPGQFVVLKISNSIYRSYSIASHPVKLPYWQIFVDITPGGPGSIFLKYLKPRQIVMHSSGKGIFTLKQIPATFNIMAATGCGLASIIPMTEELLQQKNQQIKLFWGLRYQKDLCLLNWLESLAHNPCFSYQIVLSKPTSSWHGKKGRLTAPLVKVVGTILPDKLNTYLCGNQSMIEDVKCQLEKTKVVTNRIYFERYY